MVAPLLAKANLAEYMTIMGIYVHAWFLVFAVGLPYVVLALEWKGIRGHQGLYMEAARRASMVWGVSFAAGAATGTLVEFGLVQVWSGTLLALGTFFFSVMYLELFAFMTEIVFVVLYIYTWDRFAYKWLHWLFGLVVLLGSNASALLILGANSFMNVPWGTGPLISKILPWENVSYGPSVSNSTALLSAASALASGSSVLANLALGSSLGQILSNPLIALSNPDLLATFLHTVTACVIVVAFEASSVFAYLYFRGSDAEKQNMLRLFRVSFGVGAVASLLQPVFGDLAGRVEYVYQYTKFLAAEGFGPKGGTNPILGILLKGNPGYVFPGFDQLIQEAHASISPSAALATVSGAESAESLIFPFYYGMVISGVVLFVLAVAYFFSYSPALRSFENRILGLFHVNVEEFLMYSSFFAAVLALFAGGAGWAVREIGRHPWTIYGLIPYYDVVTPASITPAFVAYVMALEVTIFVAGTSAIILVLRHEIRTAQEVKAG
ncbi:MAG: cytochrome ubiquinol oxidase subunit I [Thermoprotei archaeon]|nr:cytochrome ubiquinol oxidase subunit I [TACK group archaeon]